MAIVGGDAEAMLRFALELRARRESIEATARRLGGLVEHANWSGPDRDAFVNEWQGRHAPALASAVGQLDASATAIARHAEEQREASR